MRSHPKTSFLVAWLILAPAVARADTGDLSAYLNARAADADGDIVRAAASYTRALAAAPGNATIGERAYREALRAGDDALADRAAGLLATVGATPEDAGLLPLAEAARRGDVLATDAAISKFAGGPLRVLIPALRAWTALAAGRDPTLVPDVKEPLAVRFATEQRGLVAIAAGKTDAVTRDDDRMPIDIRIAAAQLLFNQHQDAAARALLPGTDPTFVAIRAGVAEKPTLGFGVSRLLVRVASDLAGGEPSPLSITLTRAALRADPGYDRARLLLADALTKGGAPDAALAALDGVDRAGPFADAAIAERIAILDADGRAPAALDLAKARADRPAATIYDWQRYADLLVNRNRPAEAVAYYRHVLDSGIDTWSAWLQYGGALDRAGRWPEARTVLQKAVALGPDQPLALNYLGFSQIEHGEDRAGATALLVHANAIEPRNASITDSLGWAYHMAGDTRRALPLIERAAASEPTNAEIGEHLGDAYWTLGRRYEARYAWRAATLTADTDDAPRLATKIASGLTAIMRR